VCVQRIFIEPEFSLERRNMSLTYKSGDAIPQNVLVIEGMVKRPEITGGEVK
jgi:hypothetical protein